MPFRSFQEFFPDVAKRETRSITILPGSKYGLPVGEYGFLEMFCDESGCDCRRVFFSVASSIRQGTQAVIAWGWEDVEFYRKWMKEDDLEAARDLRGPVLNMGSPETDLSDALLELARDVLLEDKDYVARIKRHYDMVRRKKVSIQLLSY